MEKASSVKTVSVPQSHVITKLSLSLFVFTSIFALPFFIHNQLVTGSMVNAGLLVSSAVFGLPMAFILSFMPSIVALLRGLLPMPFAPVIPFIILSNIGYVVIFHISGKQKIWGGLVGSLAKFAFLFSIGQLLLSHIVIANVLQKASLMIGWFQLITALIGAGIAVLITTTYQIKK